MVQSSLFHCFPALSLGLLGVLVLARCSPKAPAPVEVVLAELQVTARIDSVIAAPASIDYSAVSNKGQGPSGTLIYAAPVVPAPHGNFDAYTYDAQRRLIGTYTRTSYGYDVVGVMRYEGSLLAENYSGGFYRNTPEQGTKTWYVTRYRYDTQRRVALALMYINQDGRFLLDQTVQYQYDDAGQLQLTRVTVSIASHYNQLILKYWSNGDMYREEQYSPGYAPVTSSSRTVYNQVENPLARLYPWPHSLNSTHYMTGYGPNGQNTAQEAYQYQYTYDSQNRINGYQLRRFRSFEGQWGDWTDRQVFVYAP